MFIKIKWIWKFNIKKALDSSCCFLSAQENSHWLHGKFSRAPWQGRVGGRHVQHELMNPWCPKPTKAGFQLAYMHCYQQHLIVLIVKLRNGKLTYVSDTCFKHPCSPFKATPLFIVTRQHKKSLPIFLYVPFKRWQRLPSSTEGMAAPPPPVPTLPRCQDPAGFPALSSPRHQYKEKGELLLLHRHKSSAAPAAATDPTSVSLGRGMAEHSIRSRAARLTVGHWVLPAVLCLLLPSTWALPPPAHNLTKGLNCSRTLLAAANEALLQVQVWGGRDVPRVEGLVLGRCIAR